MCSAELFGRGVKLQSMLRFTVVLLCATRALSVSIFGPCFPDTS